MRNTICYAVNMIVCMVYTVFCQGFTISGTDLKDANGNNFIMKGINMPLAWFVTDVNNNIDNIKNKTGANCFRIVVTTSSADNSWQTCVNTCIANKIVPIVELHDVTGGTDANLLNNMAKFWVSKKAFLTGVTVSRYILINIANEWGDWAMANNGQSKWRDAYKTAITTMRNGGINSTLIVDACDWGQDLRNCNAIMLYAKELENFDPQKNIMFSVHMYCEWSTTSGSNPATGIVAVKNAGIPIMVGEFGYQHDNGNGGVCDINETQIMSTCQTNGIGWLAWSWKGNGSPVTYLDLSSDWAGNNLSTWGNTVVNGANGTKTGSTCTAFLPISVNHAQGFDNEIGNSIILKTSALGGMDVKMGKYTGKAVVCLFDAAGGLVRKIDVKEQRDIHMEVRVQGVYLIKAIIGQKIISKKLYIK